MQRRPAGTRAFIIGFVFVAAIGSDFVVGGSRWAVGQSAPAQVYSDAAEQTFFSVEDLRSPEPPGDFDAFWAVTLAEQEQLPHDLQITRLEDVGASELYKFSFAGLLKFRCYGYLSVPKDKTRKVPGLLVLPSSGVHGLRAPNVPAGDRAVMAININFWDVDLPEDAYDRHTWPAPYLVTGILSRETYSLRFCYAAVIRAGEILAARPEVRADDVLVFGSSQGGGLAVVAAGLAPRLFKGAVANVPGLCRIDRYLDGHPAYFPIAYSDETRPMIEKTLPYFDALHFARRVRCPIWIGVGLLDATTPARPAIAAFHVVPHGVRKTLLIDPSGGHHVSIVDPSVAVNAGVWSIP